MWQNDDFGETSDLFILSCNLVILQKLILSYTLKTSTMTIKRFLNILNLKGTVKAQSCGLDFSTQTHGHLGSQSTLWWFCFSFQSSHWGLTLLHWALKDHDFSRVQENSSTYERNGEEPWKPKGAGKTATTVNCLTHLSFGLHWLPFPALDM